MEWDLASPLLRQMKFLNEHSEEEIHSQIFSVTMTTFSVGASVASEASAEALWASREVKINNNNKELGIPLQWVACSKTMISLIQVLEEVVLVNSNNFLHLVWAAEWAVAAPKALKLLQLLKTASAWPAPRKLLQTAVAVELHKSQKRPTMVAAI